MTLPPNELEEMIASLEGLNANWWIAAFRAGDAEAKAVEETRAALTNGVLKPAMRENGPPLTPDALALLMRLARATLPLDRANALKNMKIVRNNPACPPGFMWVTEDALKRGEPLSFAGIKQSHSIAGAYTRLAALSGDPSFQVWVHMLTATQWPEWAQ